MATAVERDEEVVSLELPAPPGWKKKYVIANTGGIPKKNEIVFTSPTGEEITNRKSLDQYIKSHPGGPISSQFDWGTGDTPTPRRSARIIQKAKVVSPPRPPYLEIEQQPNKRRRSSITRKEEKEKEKQTKNENEREKVKEKEKEREEEQEKDAPAEETKEVDMQDSKNENLETENAAENTVKENHSEKIDSERFQKTAAAGETDNSSTEKPKQEEREEKVEQEEKPESKDGERKEEENSITAAKPVESETNKKSAVGNGIEEQKKMDATDDVLTADQQNEGKRMENGMA